MGQDRPLALGSQRALFRKQRLLCETAGPYRPLEKRRGLIAHPAPVRRLPYRASGAASDGDFGRGSTSMDLGRVRRQSSSARFGIWRIGRNNSFSGASAGSRFSIRWYSCCSRCWDSGPAKTFSTTSRERPARARPSYRRPSPWRRPVPDRRPPGCSFPCDRLPDRKAPTGRRPLCSSG